LEVFKGPSNTVLMTLNVRLFSRRLKCG